MNLADIAVKTKLVACKAKCVPGEHIYYIQTNLYEVSNTNNSTNSKRWDVFVYVYSVAVTAAIVCNCTQGIQNENLRFALENQF